MSFLAELKRRNVIKVAAAYIIVGWLIMQAGEVMAPALRLPEWVLSTLAFFLILGLPVALVFAWAFELTPDGLRREKEVDRSESITHITGRKLDFAIIGLMAIALAYFAYDKFVLGPSRDDAIAETTRSESNPITPVQKPERGPAANTIAVLPFVNISDDAANEYFSDGITEELLNLLAKIPELRVTSRSSAFSFKGQQVDIPSVAEKLGVAHVLEGSVRKAGNRVRITAQLIEAESDAHLWSETFDRELDDVFAIQDEIAREVVSALRVELLDEAPMATATNTEAFTLYLKGRHLDSLQTAESWQAAIAAYQEALAIDPEFAPAWAALSRVQRHLANMDFTQLHTGTEAARQSAGRALELDDTLADAWSALARIQFTYDWDWDRALGTIQTALQYGPGDIFVLTMASRIKSGLGDSQAAIELAQRAVEIDPLSSTSLRNLAVILWQAGRYEDEAEVLERLLELHPAQEDAQAFLAYTLVVRGQPEEAWQILQAESENVWFHFARPLTLAALGRDAEAEQALQFLIEEWGEGGAYQVAENYAFLGNADKAFEWLQTAREQRDGGYTYLVVDPMMASLHRDPRWEAVLDQVGLLPYWRDLQATTAEAGP